MKVLTIHADSLYQICKRTGVDQKTVAEYLIRLDSIRSSSESEEGESIPVSLQDASIEGYKMGLETDVIERLYNAIADTGFFSAHERVPESEPEEEPEEEEDVPEDEDGYKERLKQSLSPEQRELFERIQGLKKKKDEGYNYKKVARADVVRALTNFGFKRKSAIKFIRRGVPEALEFLRGNLGRQTPLVQRQWSFAISMLTKINETEPKKDEKCKNHKKKKK
jgi:hypothetical protein